MIRRILYSPVVTFVLHSFCRLFYSDLYLSGKFFQEKRMGYCWAIKSIPRLYSLRRRGVKFPVGKYTNILGGENTKFIKCFSAIWLLLPRVWAYFNRERLLDWSEYGNYYGKSRC